MGRYVNGTLGFSYKYVFAEQPTNLSDLAAWAGFGEVEQEQSIRAQLYADHDEARAGFVDGAGWVTCVYEASIPPTELERATGAELGPYLEQAIYNVGDSWQKIVLAIDELLGGTALRPDLSVAGRWVLRRDDWDALAKRIGHGADPGDRASLIAARDAVFESKEAQFLPLLAVNALIHAIDHDLDVMEVVDADWGQTNLWSVVDDYAQRPDDDASWDDRAAYARFLSFAGRGGDAEPLYDALLKERPEALHLMRALFAKYIWDDDWTKIRERADSLLPLQTTDANRAELLRWRGEAAWCLDDMAALEADAEESAKLGNTALKEAIVRAEEWKKEQAAWEDED